MVNDTVVHYYILRRDTSVAAGFVLAGLHADSIVAYVERAMRNNNIFATLYIHAVAVLAVPRVADIEIAQNQVLAAHRVEVPCRAVLKRNTFQQDAFAINEMQHYRTEERFDYLPEAVIGDDRHILVHAVTLRQDRSAVRIPDIFVGHYAAFLLQVFLPLSGSHLALLQRSPPVAVAVEGAMTGDGDILRAACIQRTGAALGGNALEPLVIDLIQVQIVAEDDKTILLRVQTYIGFERERRRRVDTGRDNYRTASCLRTFVNGFLDRLGG